MMEFANFIHELVHKIAVLTGYAVWLGLFVGSLWFKLFDEEKEDDKKGT